MKNRFFQLAVHCHNLLQTTKHSKFNIFVICIQHFGHFVAHVLGEKECNDIDNFVMPTGAGLLCDCVAGEAAATVLPA